jgi:hypothetical protein
MLRSMNFDCGYIFESSYARYICTVTIYCFFASENCPDLKITDQEFRKQQAQQHALR